MNESGQAIETKAAQVPVLPAKGTKRSEAEAALRGVDRVVFPDVCVGGELWHRSAVPQPEEEWWSLLKPAGHDVSTEDMYRRVRTERCFLSYMNAGIPYGGIEKTSYDAVCNLVSRLLRKQISYKEFRESFWKAVEGESVKGTAQ